jgi:predicted ArsR family transcriptional regulator
MKARRQIPTWQQESPTRKYVRRWLGRRTVRQMAEDLGISTQAIHHHLKAIRAEEATQKEAVS